MTTALEGLRVLDVSEGLAGPFAAKLLGDLGADVIKLEPPEGDEARRRGPFAGSEDIEASAAIPLRQHVETQRRHRPGRFRRPRSAGASIGLGRRGGLARDRAISGRARPWLRGSEGAESSSRADDRDRLRIERAVRRLAVEPPHSGRLRWLYVICVAEKIGSRCSWAHR